MPPSVRAILMMTCAPLVMYQFLQTLNNPRPLLGVQDKHHNPPPRTLSKATPLKPFAKRTAKRGGR